MIVIYCYIAAHIPQSTSILRMPAPPWGQLPFLIGFPASCWHLGCAARRFACPAGPFAFLAGCRLFCLPYLRPPSPPRLPVVLPIMASMNFRGCPTASGFSSVPKKRQMQDRSRPKVLATADGAILRSKCISRAMRFSSGDIRGGFLTFSRDLAMGANFFTMATPRQRTS